MNKIRQQMREEYHEDDQILHGDMAGFTMNLNCAVRLLDLLPRHADELRAAYRVWLAGRLETLRQVQAATERQIITIAVAALPAAGNLLYQQYWAAQG